MIPDQHQIPGAVAAVHRPHPVGDEEDLRTQKAHEPDGKNHVLHGVALVIVDPALHDHHRDPGNIAKDKPAGVSHHGGDGEALDLVVVHHLGLLHPVAVAAQAGAQNQGHPGLEISDLLPYDTGALQKLFIGLIHLSRAPSLFSAARFSSSACWEA